MTATDVGRTQDGATRGNRMPSVRVFIFDAHQALATASAASDEPAVVDGRPNLVFFTDGSDRIQQGAHPHSMPRAVSHAELRAIVEAIGIAVQSVVANEARDLTIRKFSDSQHCLRMVDRYSKSENDWDPGASLEATYTTPMLDKLAHLSSILDWMKRIRRVSELRTKATDVGRLDDSDQQELDQFLASFVQLERSETGVAYSEEDH
ncbi:hypothetical protein QBC34DRAFT_424168 [Podospora aff. communis PSN243]|uniref:RNase H type-1 domain-containing protein n=1 Tax=Podospora aff. communis PSN243 TaxID=3040156 RepID=A0AAV9GR91_9PEZI|nr:hypothetical protein QBC34DRAFT_424168 [Podospora aff. communis PSN243]